MNWIKSWQNDRRCWLARVATVALIASACHAQSADDRQYDLELTIEAVPASPDFRVELELKQSRRLLREVNFSIDERYGAFSGDGEIQRTDGNLTWLPDSGGGKLAWTVTVETQRGDAQDARFTTDWAIFRAEDVVPRASVTTLVGSASRTRLFFDLPAGWSAQTSAPPSRGGFRIRQPDRGFDLPTGWIAIGDLGTRLDDIDDTRVIVTGPTGESIRRLDILAFLHWTLPEVNRLRNEPLKRLSVFSAGDPMFYGGLSAPQSLFVHAELPLISENATSVLLHEIMHVAMDLKVADGHDWIQEGLAEFYSVELLRRSRSLSTERFDAAMEDMAEWGASVKTVCGAESTGPITAAGVALMHDLDRELRAAGDSLDDIYSDLVESGEPASTAMLLEAAAARLGSAAGIAGDRRLKGCASTGPGSQ